MTSSSPSSTPPTNSAARGADLHLHALDGIRGISALLVVLAHLFLLPHQFGALGVAIFFVLSGFLITWLLLQEFEASATIDLRKFYVRRALRIFPAFYVFWLFALATVWLRGACIGWPEAWASCFYFGDYYSAVISPVFFYTTWSLGIEEKFYLFWPWTFRHFCSDRQRLLRICLAGVLAVWAYRITLFAFFNLPEQYLRYAFEARIDNILYGAIGAILFADPRFHQRVVSTAGKFPRLAFAAAAALVCSTLLGEYSPQFYHYTFGMTFDAVMIVCMLMLFVATATAHPGYWLDRAPLRYLGRISYSLYLFHHPILQTVRVLCVGWNWALQIVLMAALSFAAAAASYHFIERPFLKLKNRFAVVRSGD